MDDLSKITTGIGNVFIGAAAAVNDAAPCPMLVEKLENGRIRFAWGDDPLNFVDLSERQSAELLETLAPLVNRRVEARW